MENESLGMQSRSILYTIHGHQAFENKSLPINPNTLAFNYKESENQFAYYLYFDEIGNLSIDYKRRLGAFCLILFVYTIVQTVLGYHIVEDDGASDWTFTMSVILRAGMIFISFIWLILVSFFQKPRHTSNIIFLIQGFCFILYVFVSDFRVLEGFSGNKVQGYTVNSVIEFIWFLMSFQSVVFYRFSTTVFLSLFAIFSYLIIFAWSGVLTIQNLFSEFALLIMGSVYISGNAYNSELRLRQLYWRRYKESQEDTTFFSEKFNQTHTENEYNFFNTDLEQMIGYLEKNRVKLKQIVSLIMYNDIKVQLKNVISTLSRAKNRLTYGTNLNHVVSKDLQEIDDDDQKFIAQNFGAHATTREDLRRNPPAQSQSMIFSKMQRLISTNVSEYGFDELQKVLQQFGTNWNFDIWFLYKTARRDISLVAEYLYEQYSFGHYLRISPDIFLNFFNTLESQYNENPYHNSRHACDVTNSLIFFIENSNLVHHLSQIELLSAIVASLAHDVGHPGLTNRFLIYNRDPMAIRYNDISCLENMHAALTFKLFSNENNNFMKTLPGNEFQLSRQLIIEMILQTDMSKHFEILSKFRLRAAIEKDLRLDDFNDRVIMLGCGLKWADLGHAAKSTDLHIKWTFSVWDEFFAQGDLEKERGQVVSMYCDRDTTDIAKSQLGFLTNICIPLYEAWCGFIDSDEVLKCAMLQLRVNRDYWDSKWKIRTHTMTSSRLMGASGEPKKSSTSRSVDLTGRPILTKSAPKL